MTLLALLALLISPPAWSCLHFASTYQYKIEEGRKVALMFHDGELAHLILKTDLKSTGPTLPDEVAWVMPLPSVPVKMEEVSPKVLEQVGTYVGRQAEYDERGVGNKGGARAGGVRSDPPSPFRVHAAHQVGSYRLQVIEITADSDGSAFNAWLTANRFNAMPAKLQAAYLKKGAAFVAIRAKTKGMKAADLKPVHFAYRADVLTYPLRFTHDARTFDLDLYFWSRYNRDTPHRPVQPYLPEPWLRAINREGASWAGDGHQEGTPELAALLPKKSGLLYGYEGRGLNTAGKLLRDLREDPRFIP